jgi:hypothetical protein
MLYGRINVYIIERQPPPLLSYTCGSPAGLTACLNLLIIYVLSFREPNRELCKLIDSCFCNTVFCAVKVSLHEDKVNEGAHVRGRDIFMCDHAVR